jgi:hypothetical protein
VKEMEGNGAKCSKMGIQMFTMKWMAGYLMILFKVLIEEWVKDGASLSQEFLRGFPQISATVLYEIIIVMLSHHKFCANGFRKCSRVCTEHRARFQLCLYQSNTTKMAMNFSVTLFE